MNSSLITPPDANVTEQSRKNLQDQLNNLGGMNGRRMSPDARAKKLREACEGFESIFIQKMWQEMRNTVPKSGLLESRDQQVWQDMYDQELSKSMTKAGGIGLADMMYEQLSRNLVSASRSAVGMGQNSAFTPEAAPLMANSAPGESPLEAEISSSPESGIVGNPAPNQAVAARTDSIYESNAPQTAPAPEEKTSDVASLAVNTGTAQKENLQAVQPGASPLQTEVSQLASNRGTEANQPAERTAAPRKIEKVRDNGLELANLAKREAGDKLNSRSVRPPLHPKRQQAESGEQPGQLQQAGQTESAAEVLPGSAEALRAALNTARSGAVADDITQAGTLNELVASVKSKNAAQASAPQQTVAQQPVNPQLTPQASAATQTEVAEATPTIRRVRKTTNIPQKQQGKKNDPIRMLNVDNVSVNSKAGKGLAAYHTAQASQADMQPNPAAAVEPQAVEQPIKPLTASQAGQAESPSFSIPPLKSPDAQG